MIFSETGSLILAAPDSDLEGVISTVKNSLLKTIRHIDKAQTAMEINDCLKGLSGDSLNEVRLTTIDFLNKENINRRILDSIKEVVHSWIGPDILIQKSVNLVIQPPNDPNPSVTHRDVPGNSPFEIVIWVPIVTCYGSMSLYVLDFPASSKATKLLENGEMSWEDMEDYVKKHAVFKDMRPGQILAFWSGLWHGSLVNTEIHTRVSLNFRVKSLFSPNGRKNASDYFELYSASTLTKMALGINQ